MIKSGRSRTPRQRSVPRSARSAGSWPHAPFPTTHPQEAITHVPAYTRFGFGFAELGGRGVLTYAQREVGGRSWEAGRKALSLSTAAYLLPPICYLLPPTSYLLRTTSSSL